MDDEVKRCGLYSRLHDKEFLDVRYSKELGKPYTKRVKEPVEKSGVIVNRSVMKEVDPSDNFKGMKVDDFALENIIAAGAFDMLRNRVLSHSTGIGSMDSAAPGVEALEAAVNNEQNNIEE